MIIYLGREMELIYLLENMHVFYLLEIQFHLCIIW